MGVVVGESIFLRKATGLVREIGLLSGILFGLIFADQIFSGACCITPYYAGYGNTNANYFLAFGLALIISLLVVSVYAHFSSAMPRSGGDYVFIGRTMHPLLGFAPNFSFACTTMVWDAFNLAFFASMVPLFAATFLPQAAVAPLNTTWGQFAAGMVLWVIGLILLVGMKWFLRLQYIVWIVTFIAIAVTGFYMLNAAGNFPALFNSWAMNYVPTQADMYHSVINQAVAAGFNPNPLPSEGLLMPSTLALTAVFLGNAIPFQAGIIWVAGEVKKAESALRQHVIVGGSVLVGFAVLLSTSWPWIVGVGNQFTGAFLFLGGNISGLPTDGYLWGLFPAIMPSWAVASFALAGMLCSMAVYMVGCTIISRNMFAWSFDRLFPSFFAHVSDRYKTPTFALFANMVVSVIIFVFLFLAPSVYIIFGALFFIPMINIYVVCFSGLAFPFIRKDLFEQMPLKARIAGIPVISIISFLALALLAWVATSYFTNVAFMASYGITSTMLVFVLGIWLSAIIIFFVSRAYNKRRGIDLSIAFKQIPPA
jgi:amino acid transporter